MTVKQGKEHPKMVSVIVPVYNAEKTLAACVDSVLWQDLEEWELILVNDGSTDRSGSFCDELARRDQRIRVVHQKNRGLSGARNAGIDAARGAYLCFLDADDMLESTCLSYLLMLKGTDPGCRICQANHWILSGCQRRPNAPADGGITVFSRKEAAKSVLFHDRVDVSGWGKLYDRDVFAGLRFPEGRLFEDTWLFGELLARTETYVYGSIPQYDYILREGSLTRSRFSEKNLQYIEAAKKLAADIGRINPDTKAGQVRRINHARLSVLRYMDRCPREYLPLRKRLRREILRDAGAYLSLPETPIRDRIAVSLLSLGVRPYLWGWGMYTRFRT